MVFGARKTSDDGQRGRKGSPKTNYIGIAEQSTANGQNTK